MVLYGAIMTIRADIAKKEQEEQTNHEIDNDRCRKDYIENQCDPSLRRPALEKYCTELEKCFARRSDNSVHSSHMTAELIAKILNGFVEGLELKTIIFILTLTLG